MPSVLEQLAEHRLHLDEAAPPLHLDEVTGRVHSPQLRPRRPATVVLAAAAAAIVIVGAIPITLTLMREDEVPPATHAPATTVASTAPPTSQSVEPPDSTTPPPETAAPAGDAAPDLPFDYAANGRPAGSLDTEIGRLDFFESSSIPRRWVEDGFPPPTGTLPDFEFRKVWADAPGRLEAFETEAGYLGLGSTAEPQQPRIMTGYLGDFFRVRGVGTQAEFEEAFHHGSSDPVYTQERWESAGWAGVSAFYFAPAEVWFSSDGVTWEQTAASPFGQDVLIESQPRHVVEQDGTWLILGWSGVTDPADLSGPPGTSPAEPAAWMSTDLATWTRVPFDFGRQGWDTTLESAAASDDGWIVVGERVSHETPRAYESVVWVSTDGIGWTELPLTDLIGLPHCGSYETPNICLVGFRPEIVPGGIGFYVYEQFPTEIGWRLWVGVHDE